MYNYSVGERDLDSRIKHVTCSVKTFDIKHFCFLLDRDIFEYGPNNYIRRVNVGKISEFEWDSKGIYGTTNVSPDDLHSMIEREKFTTIKVKHDTDDCWCLEESSVRWIDNNYNAFRNNCQSFVQFCLDKVHSGKSLNTFTNRRYRDDNSGCISY
jgi:hypothetical protein